MTWALLTVGRTESNILSVSEWKLKNSLVHVYTGEGKGKTTAALGVALRVLGWGGRVIVVQFIKGYPNIGEGKFAEEFGDRFALRQFASSDARGIGSSEVLERGQAAQAALEFAEEVVASGEWDLVILDEVNNAMHYGLVEVAKVLELMGSKPERTELILTGRYAPQEIIDLADYVTEMRAVRHPLGGGLSAREGVDY